MSFLAPLFFIGLAGIAVPVFVHLIQREKKNVIAFPSLMFLRKIPYQSVERRRIHNWWLLLLRLAAMILIIIGFSRPFFEQDPVQAAVAITGAREVVIMLDRSASMGYGDHWTRAQDEAKKIVSGLTGEDRGTLLLFDQGVEEALRATTDRGRLEVAISQAAVSSKSTAYAAPLRWTQSFLSRTNLPRKEAYLISDFQKSGWARQEDIHMPEGATITPVSVAELETSNLTVSSVAIQRTSFSGEERVTVTAGLTNRGAKAVTKQPVKLEVDGRITDTREVTIGPNASGSVAFDTLTVAESNMRAVVRAGTDAMPKDNDFYFVLSPSRPASVLIVQPEGADRDTNLFLTTALNLSKSPPFKIGVIGVSRLQASDFEGRSVVILNNVTALSSVAGDLLKRFVEQGGGLLVGLAEHTPVAGEWALLPGKLGATVDRQTMSATLGTLDYSHPIFEQFKDPRNGNFATMKFWRYRALTPAPVPAPAAAGAPAAVAANDRVLAKFDDGAPALSERRLGSGRVLVWTTSLDKSWNDAPNHAMFLPLVHETLRYLSQYSEPVAFHTVGGMLDVAAPIGAIVREGQAGTTTGTARPASGVAVAPSGSQVTIGQGGAPAIELAEQGFYSVRLAGIGDRRPYTVAVDLEAAEADLSALPAKDFLAGATGRGAVTVVGQSLEHPDLTPADIEKKQSLWWFLLVAGLTALLAETVLSNRLSARFGAGWR